MWQSSMVINLTSANISVRVSETFANYLGVVISFVSVGASIGIATMMDFFRKKMKLAICVLLLTSGLIFIACTLITEEFITFKNPDIFKGVLSLLLVLGISLSCACAPIAFEFAVELCYPIAEGTIGESFIALQLCLWTFLPSQEHGSPSGSTCSLLSFFSYSRFQM